MATSNPADLTNLVAIRSNLLAQLAQESAYCLSVGPKPSYSLDGESYQWPEWREAVLRKVEQLNKLIQWEKPYCVSSRGRA